MPRPVPGRTQAQATTNSQTSLAFLPYPCLCILFLPLLRRAAVAVTRRPPPPRRRRIPDAEHCIAVAAVPSSSSSYRTRLTSLTRHRAVGSGRRQPVPDQTSSQAPSSYLPGLTDPCRLSSFALSQALLQAALPAQPLLPRPSCPRRCSSSSTPSLQTALPLTLALTSCLACLAWLDLVVSQPAQRRFRRFADDQLAA